MRSCRQTPVYAASSIVGSAPLGPWDWQIMSEGSNRRSIWTVPNAVSMARLLGIPVLLWAAHEQRRGLFLWLMVALLVSDWLDGKLAAWLDQRTVLGARLDGAADALVYAALALSFWWLEAEVVRHYFVWLLLATASWVCSAGVALSRFGRLPNYHTLAYKLCWSAIGGTGLAILLAESAFVLPWAMGLVILANGEAIAIGLVLPAWQADVAGLPRALRRREESRREES